MNMNKLEGFIQSGYQGALNYGQFRSLIDNLLKENKVTGSQQLPELIPYTELNNQRMNRIDKHYQVGEAIKRKLDKLNRKYTFLTITEGWCGDSSQIVPVIEKIASVNGNIRSFYILRDDNEEIMDLFLSNGTRSIPIIICIDDQTGETIWRFGPRPQGAVEVVKQAKNDGLSKEEMSEKLHLWYGRNRQADIEKEMLDLLEKMS